MWIWIPESPLDPGLYADRSDRTLDPVGRPPEPFWPYTTNLAEALMFDSLAECRVWCDTFPLPPFTPKRYELREHATLSLPKK